MPYNPDVVYKNKGWISWVDWLDPKVINRNIPFMDFQKAREIIRSLSLGGWKEWRTHCSSAEKNPLIPRHPETIYKDKGWIDWYDWLGKEIKKYRAFKDTKKFVRELGIKSSFEWAKYCTSGNKPDDIPSYLGDYYEEWNGWYDFLGKSTDLRQYRVNDGFFKKWSRSSAYVLGFWFADGYIGAGKNIFSICQNTKDKYILTGILEKMKSNYPVSDYHCGKKIHYSKIVIRSDQIFKDVIRLGGKPNKSLDVKFPNVPKKYLPDFIRGLWDGDGCVYNGGRTTPQSNIVSASFKFIKKLKMVINNKDRKSVV